MSRGAPYFTEFSAVYLEKKNKPSIFESRKKQDHGSNKRKEKASRSMEGNYTF